MAVPEYRGLRKWESMQRAPLGTYSSLNRPSAVASQYKQQAELYNTALRTLRRQARRGDAGAAMSAIGLMERANTEGFTPGGIRRFDNVQGDIAGREQSLVEGSRDMETANQLDRRFAGQTLKRPASPMTTNPAATAGAGRGTPLSESFRRRNWWENSR